MHHAQEKPLIRFIWFFFREPQRRKGHASWQTQSLFLNETKEIEPTHDRPAAWNT